MVAACVTMKITCDIINTNLCISTISWIGSRGADNMSGDVLGVSCQRSEFLLTKMRPPRMSIEMLVQLEPIKIPARDKSLSFSTREGGIANIMVSRSVKIWKLTF